MAYCTNEYVKVKEKEKEKKEEKEKNMTTLAIYDGILLVTTGNYLQNNILLAIMNSTHPYYSSL